MIESRRLFLLAAVLICGPSFAASTAALDEAMSHDGLQKTKVKNLDLAYVRPGATLAGYRKVKLDPVEVAFHKDWKPARPGSSFEITAAEREGIRSGVAKLVYDEFARQLQAGGNPYPVVGEAGPDVLRVKLNIVNLYVNAPDTMSPGRTRTYTVSSGEMTLFAELYDSESGQVLARLVDRREARNTTGSLTLSNSATNAADAEAIASTWARILRKALDQAQGMGKK